MNQYIFKELEFNYQRQNSDIPFVLKSLPSLGESGELRSHFHNLWNKLDWEWATSIKFQRKELEHCDGLEAKVSHYTVMGKLSAMLKKLYEKRHIVDDQINSISRSRGPNTSALLFDGPLGYAVSDLIDEINCIEDWFFLLTKIREKYDVKDTSSAKKCKKYLGHVQGNGVQLILDEQAVMVGDKGYVHNRVEPYYIYSKNSGNETKNIRFIDIKLAAISKCLDMTKDGHSEPIAANNLCLIESLDSSSIEKVIKLLREVILQNPLLAEIGDSKSIIIAFINMLKKPNGTLSGHWMEMFLWLEEQKIDLVKSSAVDFYDKLEDKFFG